MFVIVNKIYNNYLGRELWMWGNSSQIDYVPGSWDEITSLLALQRMGIVRMCESANGEMLHHPQIMYQESAI